jgi:hypothetical protein
VIDALKKAGEPLSVTEIMHEVKIDKRNAADLLLGRMVEAGVIRRVRRGVYDLPPSEPDRSDRKKD